jgi:parallel beta-helix repeat protein
MQTLRSVTRASCWAIGCLWTLVAVTADEPRLPGAQAVIDAATFPSLQAAFDAVPATGGIVRIPPGTFELSEPLRITGENIHVVGAGPATHLKNVNQAGAAAIAIVPPEPFDRAATGNKRTFRWRIQLSDLRITGNEKSGPGIDALWVNEIFLHGLTISEHGGDGIRLDHCYEDPRIADCLLTYNKATGVSLLGCHDIVVSANQFEENLDALHCLDGFNLCMTGNNLDDHLGDGVRIENTYGSVVSGNMIEECNGWAVILDRDCYGDTVSSNVIAHNGGGVDLRDAHGCAISANTFTILKTHALRIGPGSDRITATGNNFSNSYLGDGQVKRATDDFAAAGVTLEGTRDVALTGNVFSGLTTPAIVYAGEPSERIALVGNVFADVETPAAATGQGTDTGNIRPE